MPFAVRPVRGREEFGRALYAIGHYFHGPPTDEQLDRFTQLLPVERMHAALEGEEIVGGAGAFPFELSVPGGTIACGGVTVVGVYPTHRRRGALRAMMAVQLRDVHDRGEPLAALWASEETIYGRFGYGLAAWQGQGRLGREWSEFAAPLADAGRARFVSPGEAAELFPRVHEALLRKRPGAFRRSPDWWRLRTLRLPDEEKEQPKRFVALELDGSVEAYAVYRLLPGGWEEGVSDAVLRVVEAVGTTPAATAAIWRFLFDVDWYATLETPLLPPDHPLFLLLRTPRRLRFRLGDSLWVRLVDVGAALAGRAYGSEGRLVLEVRDAVCPWNDGRWQLEGGACSRTDAEAELALDVSALGSAYLGAVSFAQLRDGLRLEELKPRAVDRADRLFAWRPLPWCPEIF